MSATPVYSLFAADRQLRIWPTKCSLVKCQEYNKYLRNPPLAGTLAAPPGRPYFSSDNILITCAQLLESGAPMVCQSVYVASKRFVGVRYRLARLERFRINLIKIRPSPVNSSFAGSSSSSRAGLSCVCARARVCIRACAECEHVRRVERAVNY